MKIIIIITIIMGMGTEEMEVLEAIYIALAEIVIIPVGVFLNFPLFIPRRLHLHLQNCSRSHSRSRNNNNYSNNNNNNEDGNVNSKKNNQNSKSNWVSSEDSKEIIHKDKRAKPRYYEWKKI